MIKFECNSFSEQKRSKPHKDAVCHLSQEKKQMEKWVSYPVNSSRAGYLSAIINRVKEASS